MKRLCSRLALIAGMILFLLCIRFQYERLRNIRVYEGTSLYHLDVGQAETKEFYTRYEEKLERRDRDEVEMVFFAEEKGQSIYNPCFFRQAEVTAIKVAGESALLFPESYSLEFSDKDGCLLSRSAALSLFGDTEVIGADVIFHGVNYKVRGIVNDEKNIFVYEGSAAAKTGNIEGGGKRFDHLLIKVKDHDGGKRDAQQVFLTLEISGKMGKFNWKELIAGEKSCVEIRWLEWTVQLIAAAAMCGILFLTGICRRIFY